MKTIKHVKFQLFKLEIVLIVLHALKSTEKVVEKNHKISKIKKKERKSEHTFRFILCYYSNHLSCTFQSQCCIFMRSIHKILFIYLKIRRRKKNQNYYNYSNKWRRLKYILVLYPSSRERLWLQRLFQRNAYCCLCDMFLLCVQTGSLGWRTFEPNLGSQATLNHQLIDRMFSALCNSQLRSATPPANMN